MAMISKGGGGYPALARAIASRPRPGSWSTTRGDMPPLANPARRGRYTGLTLAAPVRRTSRT